MNIAKAGIIGLTMFLLYKVISKGSAVSNLQFDIKKIAYTFASTGLILTFFVTVKNVISETISLNRIDGDVLFNDKVIGSVNNDLQITVPGSGEVTVPVSVNLFFLPVVDTITNLITGKMKGQALFTFAGTATVESIPFPIRLNYSIA